MLTKSTDLGWTLEKILGSVSDLKKKRYLMINVFLREDTLESLILVDTIFRGNMDPTQLQILFEILSSKEPDPYPTQFSNWICAFVTFNIVLNYL